ELAAVDVDGLSGDEAGIGRGKQERRAQRDPRAPRRAAARARGAGREDLAREAVAHRLGDAQARCDDVDGDAV
ncbi:MAG: hypothetical protein AVDCRST_MAG67-3152, partial [uncultured Solirubrobacteraceae bacterium]